MSDNPRVSLLPVFGLLLAVLIPPRFAYAQLPARESSTWAVLDVTGALNRAIEESNGGVALREKVVRRSAECSLTYGALVKLASNAETKKSYIRAETATMEVESEIAKPLGPGRRLEIEDIALKSVTMMVDLVKKQGDKELVAFLKKCKSLNDLNEIKNAVHELSRE
jgi:hypothetical protein